MKLKDCMPIMWRIHWLFILESGHFIHLDNIRGLRDRCPMEYTLKYNSVIYEVWELVFSHILNVKGIYFLLGQNAILNQPQVVV